MSKYFIPSRAERRRLMAYMRFKMVNNLLKMFADDAAHDWVRSANFISNTNSMTKYTTYLWDNGLTSCNCPGWANRNGKARTAAEVKDCTHCKDLRAGRCESFTPAQLAVTGPPSELQERRVFNERKLTRRLIGGEV